MWGKNLNLHIRALLCRIHNINYAIGVLIVSLLLGLVWGFVYLFAINRVGLVGDCGHMNRIHKRIPSKTEPFNCCFIFHASKTHYHLHEPEAEEQQQQRETGRVRFLGSIRVSRDRDQYNFLCLVVVLNKYLTMS